MKTKNILAIALLVIGWHIQSMAQLGKCKGKYFGNIIAWSLPNSYTDLWNQTTSENGSKWGSCDRGNGVYNFGNSDLAYNTMKNAGGAFKFHALIWGGQAPSYLKDAQPATIVTAIRNWMQAVQDHYDPMGGLNIIDVLNEPVNTPINAELTYLKEALTMGYKSEPTNQGDLNNEYGWAIWPFQLARKHFPDATLLINEYNIEMNWGNCRARYITMINAIKNAPNLTDGSKNLIDGIGLQAHGINDLSGTNFKACLDELWNSTGLPIHITEIDISADPDEAKQKAKYQELLPIAWEHEHVAGITLWGYIQGQTWVEGNKKIGPSGTSTGLIYSPDYTANPLGDRPAMTWIKQYMASQTDLACCPDPGPFANCINGIKPTISFTSPTAKAFVISDSITFDVDAADADGTISHIDYFINKETTTFHEEWMAPYDFKWAFADAGTYTITAIAYDDKDNATKATITVKVNVPQGPFGGTPAAIPGKIEFENFDEGGNGFAYVDSTEGNDASGDYRPNEDVDIENCSDTAKGYNLGWTKAGEWLEYTVNVQTTGKYDLLLRASTMGDKTLTLSSDGVDIATDIKIADTKDWQTWTNVTVNDIALDAGEHILRVTIGNADYINLNYMTFTLQEEPQEPILLTAGWNLIGCPIEGETEISSALSSIWDQVITVKDMDSFYTKERPAHLNLLKKLSWGKGYMVKVGNSCELDWQP